MVAGQGSGIRVVRYAMRSLCILVLGLGFLCTIWYARKQTWHDNSTGDLVVLAQPLQNQIPSRRPEPLVSRNAVWWLAGFSALLVAGSIAFNVLVVVNADGQLFEPEYYTPSQRDGPRIHALETVEDDRLAIEAPRTGLR